MAKPRDQFGRPLRGADADRLSYPQVPEREIIDGPTAWAEAEDYFNRNLPFHVHEVCEQRWRCAPTEEQSLWQALAQWGAALTHEARGNPKGTQAVALRAQRNFLNATHIPPYVKTEMIRESLQRLLA